MNSEYIGVYTAYVGKPAEPRLFDSIEKACDFMFDEDQFASVPKWYHGGDFIAEINNYDDLFIVLLAHLKSPKYFRKLCKILEIESEYARTIFEIARPEIAAEIFV